MNSKSLLVTGGAGYIGTTLIRDALELGYNVTCLDLLVYGGKPLSTFFNHPRFKFIQGDIRDKKILNSILKDIDLVVNLAAIVGDKPCQAAPDSAVSINSLGAKILADCCIKNSIEKMHRKHCDIIVANDVSSKETGFNVDLNEVTIIENNGEIQKIKKGSKKFIASIIAQKIINSFLDFKKRLN